VNSTEFQVTQERTVRFERFLAEARKSGIPETTYKAMAEGYLIEIEKMQAEVRAYLGSLPTPVEAT
jgi:hypothetical protein